MGDVVDQTNTAIAYANCNECTTVAISVQILLVSGSPDQVTPTNLAVALNENCTECQTLASAYQFVFGTGEELRFTAEGRKQIADIRKRFKELRKSGLTTDEIKAQADALAQELRKVLASEVTTRGSDDDDEDDDEEDERATTSAGDDGDDDAPGSDEGDRSPPPATGPSGTTGAQPAPKTTPAPTTTTPAPTTTTPAPKTTPAPAPETETGTTPQTTPTQPPASGTTQP